jgi:hypothetical protein
MSAHVIDMRTFRREGPSDEQRARDAVQEQLDGKVTTTIMAQAKARAVRSIVGGRPIAEAVYTAVAWAKYAAHDDAPERA